MTSPWIDIGFWGLGVGSVWFGWRVFRTASMVRASFSLLASFSCVAAILILLSAEYLGLALVFMMALEMTVMALFMVAFMMNPAGLNPMQMVHQQRAALAVAAVGGLGLAGVAWAADVPARPFQDVTGSIVRLGHELLGDSMLVFESVGVALLATMLGAVILSARTSRYGVAADAGSLPPRLDPDDPDSIPGHETAEAHSTHEGHGGHA